MKRSRLYRIVLFTMCCALLLVGCEANQSTTPEPAKTAAPATSKPTPKKLTDREKKDLALEKANDWSAYLYLDWNYPDGVKDMSSVSISSAEVDKNGNVVLKGHGYGKDEYGHTIGIYDFDWIIRFDDVGVIDCDLPKYKKAK